MGLHDFAAVVMFVGYYCIDMPLSGILVYGAGMEVYGVWVALIVATGSISIALFIRILYLDFEGCVKCVRKGFVLENESFEL